MSVHVPVYSHAIFQSPWTIFFPMCDLLSHFISHHFNRGNIRPEPGKVEGFRQIPRRERRRTKLQPSCSLRSDRSLIGSVLVGIRRHGSQFSGKDKAKREREGEGRERSVHEVVVETLNARPSALLCTWPTPSQGSPPNFLGLEFRIWTKLGWIELRVWVG